MTSSSLSNPLVAFLPRLCYPRYLYKYIVRVIPQALQVIREKCATIVREIEQIETGGLGMQMEMEEEDPDAMEEEE